ncbi:MAG TPA: DAK2 domain-containing protein [Spirochaetia bacterium]|nr:DAK2 domain-containing protein [Spirochaetia bacterium]
MMTTYLIKALETIAESLSEHEALINYLNVFPIPDGDTGTNMLQTIRRTLAVAEGSESVPSRHQIAEAAISGAQGNSGVILAQFLQGFIGKIDSQATVDQKLLAEALRAGTDSAYTAVLEPKEGTILTVMNACADAANDSTGGSEFAKTILDRGFEALSLTKEILPELRDAGVVDSGGLGFLCVMYGLLKSAFDGEVPFPDPEELKKAVGIRVLRQQSSHPSTPQYCLEFVLENATVQLDLLRSKIADFGNSVVVAENGGAVHVHVHTNNPDQVISFAMDLGAVSSVKCDDTHQQMTDFAESALIENLEDKSAEQSDKRSRGIGVITVASSAGLARIMKELGATAVIIAPTMSPSVGQLIDSIERVPFDSVVLLPNSGNGLMVAEAAAKRTHKDVHVVASRTIPEGIAVLVSLPLDQTELDFDQMHAAMERVRTLTVARSVKDTVLYGTAVKEGAFFATDDSSVLALGTDRFEVALRAIDACITDTTELITIFFGWSVTEDEADTLRSTLVDKHPAVDVQIYSGRQSHIDYIVGLQ